MLGWGQGAIDKSTHVLFVCLFITTVGGGESASHGMHCGSQRQLCGSFHLNMGPRD